MNKITQALEILALYHQGLSPQKIADKLGGKDAGWTTAAVLVRIKNARDYMDIYETVKEYNER